MVLSVGLMRRFYGSTRLARTIIDTKIFGQLEEIWAGEGGQMTRTARGADWYQTDRKLAGGGVLIETGSHLIDQLVNITGARKTQVENYKQAPDELAMEFFVDVEGWLGLQDDHKLPFKFVISRSRDVCNGIFLRFNKIFLRIDPGPDGNIHICKPDGSSIAPISTKDYGALNSTHAFYLEWLEFIDKCRNAASHAFVDNYLSTRLSVEIIENCYSSLSLK
jgi:predicted dehydrogenase